MGEAWEAGKNTVILVFNVCFVQSDWLMQMTHLIIGSHLSSTVVHHGFTLELRFVNFLLDNL